jgi:hypothetical protein
MTENKPVLSWDTCDIAQNQAQFLIEQAQDEGLTLTEDQAFNDACEDQDLYDFEWRDLCENLTDIMNRINPEGCDWLCKVANFGWMHRNGHKTFRANDGKKLLQEVLPETDCTFKIFDHGDHITINNAHHDAPTGGEIYTIELGRTWRVKSRWETDENDNPVYLHETKGWVEKDLAMVLTDREKQTFKLPTEVMVVSTRNPTPKECIVGEFEEIDEAY